MQIGGTYMINAAEEYNKDGHNIGVVPLPTPEGKDAVTVAGGQMLGVSDVYKRQYKTCAANPQACQSCPGHLQDFPVSASRTS